MKNNRKILALVLAVFMSAVMLVAASGLEIFIIASSDEYESYATSAKYLEILDIMKGYEDGELHLDEPILRYQAALLFSRVVTGVLDDAAWGTGASTVYTDVPEYGKVMDLITSLDIIRGYGDGVFGYNDGIRYQDMCAMFVRVLGYDDGSLAYPMGYVLKVEELGLGLDDVLPADYLNRGQVAQMLYDALVTDIADAKNDAKAEALAAILAGAAIEDDIDDTKDTYLERNFNVSSRMTFQILATENYILEPTLNGLLGVDRAEEGYFTAVTVNTDDVYTIWNFPIDGEATNGVTEADLIGKYITVVFDDKTPTAEEFEAEDVSVVHAEMVKGVKYENRGELKNVKFSDDGDYVYFGSAKYAIEDLMDTMIVTYSEEDESVYELLNPYQLEDVLSDNTYFEAEVYDVTDEDEVPSFIKITPYKFGQYARRRYGDKYYTMVGQYTAAPVYNISTVSEKTDANMTHFVERFLVTGALATKINAYRPEDVKISVGDEGRYSLNATLTGEAVKNGDFVLYTYNIHTGEFCVVENLGTYHTGTLTGMSSKKQTFTIDGSKVALGLAGSLADTNGLLLSETAYEATEMLARDIIDNYTAGEVNVRYLEFDTRVVYLEAYGGPAANTGDYTIVDIDASLEAAIDADEEAWDIIIGDGFVTVKALDPATGELSDINVEVLYTHDNTAVKFTDVNDRHFFGTWADMQGYSAFKGSGVIFYTEDDDKNGLFELYAYGSEGFKASGASVVAVDDGEPSIYFTYGKSNNFVETDNDAGITVDRVATGSKTVAIIIGADGYIMHKGSLGTNTELKPNELYLSSAAKILAAGDRQLTIFDPASNVKLGAENNVFENVEESIWNAGDGISYEGYDYYVLLSYSTYVDTSAYVDENGELIRTEEGDALFSHNYTSLYNLMTGASEDVAVITTSPIPVFTEMPNSTLAVLRVDAANYDAQATTFAEVYVANDIYREASFEVLRQKDWMKCVLHEKDIDGDGVISEDEAAFLINHDSNAALVYSTLDGFNLTFIDFDAGVDVNRKEYNYSDSYIFYNVNDNNSKNCTQVTLLDREDGVHYAETTRPIKRMFYGAKDFSGEAANGAITTGLTAGVMGKVYAQPYFCRNNWADYLIPAVDSDGETIWKYEGSLRVSVRYEFYAYYDEDTNTLDVVAVRFGTIDGVVGTDVDMESFIDMSAMPVVPDDTGTDNTNPAPDGSDSDV